MNCRARVMATGCNAIDLSKHRVFQAELAASRKNITEQKKIID